MSTSEGNGKCLEDNADISEGMYYLKLFIKDPVLPIMHCALAIIGSHFLGVENRKISVGL